MKEVKYENKIVTWIDILGFKDAVAETIKPAEESKHSIEELQQIFHHIDEIIKDYLDVWTRFSDTIIIISSPKFESDLYRSINKILIFLLEHKLVARGAMVRGDVYFSINSNKHLDLFGPAIIEAYKIEQQAIYPRIIIDESVLKLHLPTLTISPTNRKFNIEESLNGFGLIKDFDGFYFIDYLTAIRCMPKEERNKIIPSFNEMIEKEILNKDITIAKKYRWLKTHWAEVNKKNIVVDLEDLCKE